MSYFLQTSLPCFLAISATVALAAGGIERFPERDNKPSAGSAAPPILLALGGQQEDTNDNIFIEGLWPVLQRDHSLWFAQGGWQRQQQRNLLSLGLGWRYSPEAHWGLGYNLFYDQDTTEHQRRVGLGAEAWLHTLTLSANGYLPAKGWRAAGDLKGYQQRVASGYDVILRGYLPFLPQLGASVRYAHYFGDEVAWGGASQRHKNPQQWRWGVDFTPIPLLTLAYHRHTGCSGHAKQQISAVVSYRFDLPFSQQVDPNQVARLHSASGQRLARVNRERIMILKYTRQVINSCPGSSNVYDQQGYDRNGFDQNGFDQNGFDQNGFDQNGFDQNGFDQNGFDQNGFDQNGFDQNGFDQNGFDQNGFDQNGFDQNGFDQNGVDRDGFKRAGNRKNRRRNK